MDYNQALTELKAIESEGDALIQRHACSARNQDMKRYLEKLNNMSGFFDEVEDLISDIYSEQDNPQQAEELNELCLNIQDIVYEIRNELQ